MLGIYISNLWLPFSNTMVVTLRCAKPSQCLPQTSSRFLRTSVLHNWNISTISLWSWMPTAILNQRTVTEACRQATPCMCFGPSPPCCCHSHLGTLSPFLVQPLTQNDEGSHGGSPSQWFSVWMLHQSPHLLDTKPAIEQVGPVPVFGQSSPWSQCLAADCHPAPAFDALSEQTRVKKSTWNALPWHFVISVELDS